VQIATTAGRAGPVEFEQVLGELYPALVRRLTLVVGDVEEAKDLAQTTFLRASQSWHRFDGRDARAWLYTIGLRLAFRERRRRQRWRAFFVTEPVAEPWQPAHESVLWEALRTLRREERAALLLNVVDRYTQAEIAEMLDVPSGTVASWVSRAKTQLREQLGKE
jgi:RNA polymerase sigma-70 factor (ECF subfamily)